MRGIPSSDGISRNTNRLTGTRTRGRGRVFHSDTCFLDSVSFPRSTAETRAILSGQKEARKGKPARWISFSPTVFGWRRFVKRVSSCRASSPSNFSENHQITNATPKGTRYDFWRESESYTALPCAPKWGQVQSQGIQAYDQVFSKRSAIWRKPRHTVFARMLSVGQRLICQITIGVTLWVGEEANLGS